MAGIGDGRKLHKGSLTCGDVRTMLHRSMFVGCHRGMKRQTQSTPPFRSPRCTKQRAYLLRVCACLRIYRCLSMCVFVCVFMHAYIRTYVCTMYRRTYVSICLYAYVMSLTSQNASSTCSCVWQLCYINPLINLICL